MLANRPRRLVSYLDRTAEHHRTQPSRTRTLATPIFARSAWFGVRMLLAAFMFHQAEGGGRAVFAYIPVTHDMAFAAEAADRIAYFESGVIAEEGDPEKLLFDSPADSTEKAGQRLRLLFQHRLPEIRGISLACVQVAPAGVACGRRRPRASPPTSSSALPLAPRERVLRRDKGRRHRSRRPRSSGPLHPIVRSPG